MSFMTIAPGLTGLDSKYRFKALPIAEADANADNYVCEFTGATGNEVGAGGGVSGADLVLTAYNSPGPSVGGYRPIAKDTNQAFGVTVGLINGIIRSAPGCAFLWRLKDIDVAVTDNRHTVTIKDSASWRVSLDVGIYTINGRSVLSNNLVSNPSDSMGVNCANGDALSSRPAGTGITLLTSFDYATRTSFTGFAYGDTQPMGIADCSYFALNRGDVAFILPSAISALLYNNIIGSSIAGTYATGLKIGSVTMAKYPAVVPV